MTEADDDKDIEGLSPPTRGNRHKVIAPLGVKWSIPAHAGEPASRQDIPRKAEVYPRPRGGTPSPPPALAGAHGLSPPTRGNP